MKTNAKINALLAKAGSLNPSESGPAMHELAVAFTPYIREGVLKCDILDNIFTEVTIAPGQCAEFPLDFIQPGMEDEFKAFTIPACGRIPQCTMSSDRVFVPMYWVGNCIDWCLQYARDARWDVVGRAMEVIRNGFITKNNDDGWHTLLGAGYDRNIIVSDSAAEAGQFTKRLVSLMKTVMRRNAGGNSGCSNRGELTDLYMSPEAVEDIRNWGESEVDPVTRREIFQGCDSMTGIYCVNLHALDELGQCQPYQKFYEVELAGGHGMGLPAGKIELVVGLDLKNRDSFLRPTREPVQIFEDMTLHRQMRAGFYGWAEGGWAVLDSRRVLLGAI